MKQDSAALQERAQVADEESPDYLPTECLVHIIQEAKRGGHEQRMSALLPWLLARCEAILLNRIPDKSRPNAPEIREEILADVVLSKCSASAFMRTSGVNEMIQYASRFQHYGTSRSRA